MAGSFSLRTALVLSVLLSPVLAAETPSKQSPFLPPPGATAPAQPGPAAYTLGGMTVHGKETLLSITRESDKRSTWIPVGKTVGDITVVSYDPKKDEAVIRAEGREHVLPMRKAVIVSAPVAPIQPARTLPALAPNAASASQPAPPPEPVKLPPLNQQEEKEMEARMLVSDLLEIGQQQRRAYEAAQREAAAKAAAESRAKSQATPPSK